MQQHMYSSGGFCNKKNFFFLDLEIQILCHFAVNFDYHEQQLKMRHSKLHESFSYLFLHKEHVHLLAKGLRHFLQQLFDLQRPLKQDDSGKRRRPAGSEVGERRLCCV